MVVQTSWIRPDDRNAARRVREIVLEFKKTGTPGDFPSLTVDVDEEQGNLQQSFSWTPAEIAAAYPNAAAERVILRCVPQSEFESVSVTVTLPPTLNLQPVSCAVVFGIEPGVQRRYPEGVSK